MAFNALQWRNKENAPPWKRLFAFFIDLLILLPPVFSIAFAHHFNPFPGVSLFYWIVCSIWGWYTFLFGIGMPLLKGFIGLGDAIMKLAVTDLEGQRISRFKLFTRQIVFCFLLVCFLLPSFWVAAFIINGYLFSSMFQKDKKYNLYMNSIDRLFKTTVMSIEFIKNPNDQ
jgi:uncharacterized RDD family membrane protein YckC